MNTKYITVALLSLILIPSLSWASIDTNLSYGARGSEVTELQEFLIDGGYLTGSATGNFYALTLKAVKKYQTEKGLPSTGYVGSLTRKSINDELLVSVGASVNEEIQETGTTTPAVNNDAALKAAQEQSRLLGLQIQAQLDAQAKLDAINQSINSLSNQLKTSTTTIQAEPISITVNQPVCTSKNQSTWSVNNNWNTLPSFVVRWNGGTTYSLNTDGSTTTLNINSTGHEFHQNETTSYQSVNIIGNLNYSLYKTFTGYNDVPLSSGTLQFPNCSNY